MLCKTLFPMNMVCTKMTDMAQQMQSEYLIESSWWGKLASVSRCQSCVTMVTYCVGQTVILQVFIEVLFSIFSVVNGFTEMRKIH